MALSFHLGRPADARLMPLLCVFATCCSALLLLHCRPHCCLLPGLLAAAPLHLASTRHQSLVGRQVALCSQYLPAAAVLLLLPCS
jgi:hypothetical protein